MLVIYDSEQESAEYIKQVLQTECGISEQSIYIFKGTPQKLYNIIKNDRYHTIKTIFIEISMETSYNGINVAAEIVKLNIDIHIVFITSYGKFYIQQAFLNCYDLNPCAYLIKPVNRYFLRKTIDKINHIEKSKSVVWIKTQHTAVRVKASDVFFIGIEGRCTVWHTNDGIMKSYTKMEETARSIPETFIRCHKSFIVNTQHITAYNTSHLILNDETQIPISRSYRREIRDYMNALTNPERSE